MVFQTNLVAIAWMKGEYKVLSSTIAQIDTKRLQDDGYLNDVSSDVGYRDNAGVINKESFDTYLLKCDSPMHARAGEWFYKLPKETQFIMVHDAEYDSGFGD